MLTVGLKIANSFHFGCKKLHIVSGLNCTPRRLLCLCSAHLRPNKSWRIVRGLYEWGSLLVRSPKITTSIEFTIPSAASASPIAASEKKGISNAGLRSGLYVRNCSNVGFSAPCFSPPPQRLKNQIYIRSRPDRIIYADAKRRGKRSVKNVATTCWKRIRI